MKQIPLGEHVGNAIGMQTWPSMINALYSSAQRYSGLAPEGGDPGAAALKGAIGTLLGIQIDYYAMVDMAGFVGVVDALGGVTMQVPEPMSVRLSPPVQGGEWRVYTVPAGEQHLDGHTALAYVRSRTGNSDYHRMQRQRCLMGAIAQQSDSLTVLRAFPDLAPIIKEIVQTDIPLDQLPELVKLRDTVDLDGIVAVGFTPPNYISGWAEGGYPIPNVELIQQTVQDVFNLETQPLETIVSHCS